jgi:hypothetical protein
LVDTEDPTRGFSVVGNGGLSLRRVQRASEVLRSKHFLEDPKIRGMQTGPRSKLLSEALESSRRLKRLFIRGKTLLHRWGYHNNARWLARDTANSHRHEDHFWAYDARKVVKEFRIPEPAEALEFSFELAPRYCFTMNGGRLPFGCHAWFRLRKPIVRFAGAGGMPEFVEEACGFVVPYLDILALGDLSFA